MIKGIFVNGKHSYYSYGLRMLKRTIGSPPKDEHLERVPYSSVTHDFSSIYGKASYGERTLTYQFEFMNFYIGRAEDNLVNILNWLHWSGRIELYDDMLPDYHFEVREPTVTWSEDHGVYTFNLTFKANPEILPNPNKYKYNAGNVVFPDVNGDGVVDGNDASMISKAYADQMTGKELDLTDKQKLAADADMNGVIDANDASLVLSYYAKCVVGEYRNTPEGWAEFLNDVKGGKKEVY